MRFTHSSYQTFLASLVCFVLFFTVQTYSAEIYLDPGVSNLTAPIGEEFQLELKVDANTLGLRLFQVFIKFESSKLDTVSSALGSLFVSSGNSTFYNMKMVFDSTSGDSMLKVEGLLLGASSVVDGPGTVAVITLKTTGVGIADLSILNHTLTDVNNDTIPSTSVGAVAYINTPPAVFNLLSPTIGEVISKFPGELVQFVWESTNSVYAGENILYDLEYSADNSFPPSNTVTVTGLTDTTYSVLVDNFANGAIFWRVHAIGDIYSFVRNSSPYPNFFDFSFSTQEPDPFDIISPNDGRLENLIGDINILFDWEDALPASPADTIEYTFYMGVNPTFPSVSLLEIPTGTNSQVSVVVSSLPYCQQVYWTVEAKNQHGLTRWANSVNSITFMRRGDVDCSGGLNAIDISDIVFFVSFMFGGGSSPTILESGNVDCSTSVPIIDISDLVFIVNYSFGGGASPDCDL